MRRGATGAGAQANGPGAGAGEGSHPLHFSAGTETQSGLFQHRRTTSQVRLQDEHPLQALMKTEGIMYDIVYFLLNALNNKSWTVVLVRCWFHVIYELHQSP